MGQGGYIVLVNGTKYTWDRSGCGAYQMEWKFGNDEYKVVQPYSTITVYVEVEDGHWVKEDDSGFAEYTMRGEVHKWMHVNLDKWQNRTVRQLCVPASHDSGMSLVTWKTRLASVLSIITQYNSVYAQLNNGVRYFDLRPVFHNGQWVSGHYTFTSEDHHELIVMSVSHVQVINDQGAFDKLNKGDFRDPKLEEWNNLLGRFETLQQRWSKASNDLMQVPLKDFIGPFEGPWQLAVVLLLDDSVDIGTRAGMFHNSTWPWNYSDWQRSESDRLNDFKTAALKPGARPYSYSGCHTQTTEEAIACNLGQSSKSVLKLSENPKNKLFTELFPACTENLYPRSLTMDAIDSSDLAALCLAINDRTNK
ncbi:MAG: hypothetical protein Q9167_005740 [Letrouitia subvulpina]